MSQAIPISLMRIKHMIPPQILQLAFMPTQQHVWNNISIDQQIVDKVVNSRVRKDCNLLGGKTIQISLTGPMLEQVVQTTSQVNSGTGSFSIYRIPPDQRDFCDITEVHRVMFPLPNAGGHATTSVKGATICAYTQELIHSRTGGGIPPTPTPELLSGDLVRLHPGGHTQIDWVLVCQVAYDEAMNSLNGSSVDAFAELCVLATKMYIYNQLIIQLDRSYVEYGMDIASVRQIIEPWSDLNEEYREKLNKFVNGNMMDLQRVGPLLKYML